MAINPSSENSIINEGDKIGIADGPKIGNIKIMKLLRVVNPLNAKKSSKIKIMVDFLDLKNPPLCCFL